MKPLALLGILLILCGIAFFAYQGVIWVVAREDVAQIGPVTIQKDKPIGIPIAPIAAGALIAGGLVLLASRGRESPTSL